MVVRAVVDGPADHRDTQAGHGLDGSWQTENASDPGRDRNTGEAEQQVFKFRRVGRARHRSGCAT